MQAGETTASAIRAQIDDQIATEPLVELDYVEIVEGNTLNSIDQISQGSRILLAAKIGKARLIDNVDPYCGIT